MSAGTALVGRLSPHRLLPGAICGALSAACAVGLLAASAYLVTRAGQHAPIGTLMGLIVGVRAFALGRACLRYLERLASHDGAFRMLADLRTRMFARLVRLAPDGLRRLGRGDLLSRLVSDVDDQQNLPLRVVMPLATSLAVGAGSVAAVWSVLPAAGLALAAALVAALAAGAMATRLVGGRSETALAGLRAEHAESVIELVGSLDVLIAYGALPERQRQAEEAADRLRRNAVRRAAGAGVVSGLMVLLAGAATILALALGASPASEGQLTAPWYAVLALVPIAVFEVFAAVPLAWSAWRGVAASADRIAHVVPVDRPPEIPDEDPGDVRTGTDRVHGEAGIRIRGLHARWPDTGRAALHGIDLDVALGECVLLTGESGAGKTTLAHVLVRFLDYSGSYRISGREASSMPPAAVRRVVGLCEQSPHIFDNTVRNNLSFAREGASDDELWAVLERVGLASFLAGRGGLDARLGERGALASGGQAQRLALARALLADFPVLVLDEPTANVDPARAERLLADLLGAASGTGRSILLISHAEVPEYLVCRHVRLTGGRITSAGDASGGDRRGTGQQPGTPPRSPRRSSTRPR